MNNAVLIDYKLINNLTLSGIVATDSENCWIGKLV